jgi:very-short-patch-repair endonuclease
VGVTRARALRRDGTRAEQLLWGVVRNRQVDGAKFRRQHPVGRFVVDFACVDVRVVLEVDGGQHAESAVDVARSAWLVGEGWVVVRFWNDDVVDRLEGVVERIGEVVRARRGELGGGRDVVS